MHDNVLKLISQNVDNFVYGGVVVVNRMKNVRQRHKLEYGSMTTLTYQKMGPKQNIIKSFSREARKVALIEVTPRFSS